MADQVHLVPFAVTLNLFLNGLLTKSLHFNLKQCVGRGERLVNRSVVELTTRYSAGDIDARVTGNMVIATTGIDCVFSES